MSCIKEINNLNNTVLKEKSFKIVSIHGKPTIRNTCSMFCDIHGFGDSWGNPWNPTIRSLKQGKGCPKCSKRYQYLEDEIINNINSEVLVNKSVTLKSIVDYQNTNSRCIMTCTVHGDSDNWDKHWIPRISDLKYGVGCPKCAHELKDIYKLFNQPNDEGFNTKTKLYFIKFKRKNKTFSKIGITQQEIHQRFKPCNLKNANLEIVDYETLELPTLKALLLEFYLLNKFSDLKEYQPSLKNYNIGGSTECFNSDINTKIDLNEEIKHLEMNAKSIFDKLLEFQIITEDNKKIFLNKFY